MPAPCSSSYAGRSAVRHRAVLFLLSGLAFAAPATVSVCAQTLPATRTATADPYAAHIAEASQRFGIPQTWIVAVKRAESHDDVRAVSPAGALGLMQIMPGTWAELRTRYRLGHDPFDPRDNIIAGTAYLREMLDRYRTVPAMLAAYNAGPALYDEYLATGRSLPAETRAYVALLAPALGSAAPSDRPRTALQPPADWREAPLFVARDDNRRPADDRAAGHPSSGQQPSVPAQDDRAARSQPDTIFLTRREGDGPQ
ncbi:transglycosylase SLT domain-containing protein [Agrobacterium vitis]|uniref:Lytic transglycosylase domain-containing protein n=1 Tax=Agrobacterium vitis TaxID=373 RepID=A0A368NYN9_AGRVI|nr:lytic transglycosylase domain-containing protein [Agrobacterium vitis]KAA3528309.1 lytic transglycosylase domain-containing protein [Agrobacterium vitis]MUZ97848.1 transglycosylase SLT domain-containing protein [Agrobacterium vitis]NOJ35605.1 lytic transglycosylase domain-containing protein [Agrobacterium vitis]RCU54609.1 lytic transglycosylase domain-containing protein [Agrobacterium vitis]